MISDNSDDSTDSLSSISSDEYQEVEPVPAPQIVAEGFETIPKIQVQCNYQAPSYPSPVQAANDYHYHYLEELRRCAAEQYAAQEASLYVYNTPLPWTGCYEPMGIRSHWDTSTSTKDLLDYPFNIYFVEISIHIYILRCNFYESKSKAPGIH